MVEYTGLVLGLSASTYCLLYLSFKLGDKYDPLKMFLVAVSFVFGALLIHLGGMIAEANAAPTGVVNAMGYALGTWITVTLLVWTYMLVYVVPDVWRTMKSRSKKDLYGGEE